MPPKRTRTAVEAPTRTQPKRGAATVKPVNPDSEDEEPVKQPASKKRKVEPTVGKDEAKPTSQSNASKTKNETKATTSAKSKTAPKKQGPATERDESERCYWLMKAEPETRLEKGVDVKFSIDDLAANDEPEPWDGVRNPVAQKNMRNMRKGELAFFYHSNCKIPGIAGVMKIVQEASTDESAFDPKHPYFDPKSDREKPRWIVVHVEFVKKFDNFVPLKKLQEHAKPGSPLETLQTLKLSRLSVSQVKSEEWDFIVGLAGEEAGELVDLSRKAK